MTAIVIIVSLPGGNLENTSNSAMIYQLSSFSSPSPTIPSKNLFVLLNKRPGNYKGNSVIRMMWYGWWDIGKIKNNPVGIYLFKVNNRLTRTLFEICSKLTIKIPERLHWRLSGVFIVNFEDISHIVLVFLLLILIKQMPAENRYTK